MDRQLTAFVNSNISDTIRDSRAFLEQALDDTVLAAVADEVWQSNAEVTIADAVRLVRLRRWPNSFGPAGRPSWCCEPRRWLRTW